MDNTLLLMTGGDYPIPQCQTAIHQPSIEEIGLIGEEVFFKGLQTLIIDKQSLNMDNSVISDVDNFQIFMMIMGNKETIDKKQAVEDLLQVLFLKKKIIITPQSILLTEGTDNIVIDQNNFIFLQAALKDIFCLNSSLSTTTGFNPKDKKAQEIADKIMKGRQKIAQERGGNNGSIYAQYLSILSIGIHLSINELKKYTIFQIYDAIERFELYTEFDLDIRTRLAGGTPNKAPENWMKNIH